MMLDFEHNSEIAQLDSLVADIEKDSKDLMEQLDSLKTSIGDQFAGLNETVAKSSELISSIANIVGRSDIAASVQKWSAIATISLEIVSAFSKVKAHNDALDALMKVKQARADGDLMTCATLIPRFERHTNMANRLLIGMWNVDVPNAVLAKEESCEMYLMQCLKILSACRTSTYYLMVLNYINTEANAWSEGKQTAGIKMPCYFDANKSIIELLNTNCSSALAPKEILLDIADDKFVGETIPGAALILANDIQLVSYILQELNVTICVPQNTLVGRILAENPAIEEYNRYVGDIAAMMSELGEDQDLGWVIPSVCSVIAIIIAMLTSMSLGGKIAMILITVCALWGLHALFNYLYKSYLYIFTDLRYLRGRLKMEERAGYVDSPDLDLEKKSYWKTLLEL